MTNCIGCKNKFADGESAICLTVGLYFESDDPYEQFCPDHGTEPTGHEEFLCVLCLMEIKKGIR